MKIRTAFEKIRLIWIAPWKSISSTTSAPVAIRSSMALRDVP
jgi:hypothetical protein